MSIRQEVSKILDYTIPPKGFRKAFRQLQIEGRISMKHVLSILALLVELEEEKENEK